MALRYNVVAIIDDDEAMRESLHHLLSASGYCTELYASAEEFISVVVTTKASCLVVDMHLGTMSGLELGHRLSAAGFVFPIIFITGSTSDTVRRQAMNFGCIAFLNKPFPADQLIEAIIKASITPHGDGKCG